MNQNADVRRQRAQILLLVVVVVWATNFPIAKFAISKIDVFVFNAIRFVVAAGVLVALFLHSSTWVPIEKSDWRSILRAGIVANVLYQCAFIVGLHLTTATNSAVLMATSPLWTMFFSARLHKEKIHPAMWLGMALSLCGVIMIVVGSGRKLAFGGHEIIGDLICLTAAILWGLSTNLQKPLLVRYSSLHLATVMISIGAVGLLIIALPAAVTTDWSSIGATYWIATVVSGMLSIGLANAFWSYGVQRLGPGRTSSFSNLVPVLAFLVSYVALKEEVYPIQIVGSVVTITGVWISRR